MTDLKTTKKANENQQSVIEDHINTIKRIQAEFENYVKRVEKEKEQFTSYSNHKLISKLLNIFDDLEKAVSVVEKHGGEVADGVKIIHKQMNKMLEEEGVKKINAKGSKLDPYKHEVIDIVHGKENDVVVEELQKGYMLKDKVLRTSKVRISKFLENDEVNEDV